MKTAKRYNTELIRKLHEAENGNAESAYQCALAFETLGYREFFVQKQYQRAAQLNYPLALRWLGILGLCHVLMTDESSFNDIRYCQDDGVAVQYLERAAAYGDLVSRYILAKCRQVGIGMSADEQFAETELLRLVPHMDETQIIGVALLFDMVRTRSTISVSIVTNAFPMLKKAV